MNKNKLFIVGVFVIGAVFGLFMRKAGLCCMLGICPTKKTSDFHLTRLFSNGTSLLINPLVQIENPPGGDDRLESIKSAINGYADKRMQSGEATKISVYLRNLDTASWVGINEDTKFIIASLYKVPVMIAYLKASERDPNILNKEILYSGDGLPVLAEQNILPQKSPQIGKAYTINELLHNMIIDSDNISFGLLMKNLKDEYFINSIYSDLKLPSSDTDYISPKEFAAFLRILYNATYLNKDLSEKAMEMLAHINFHEGIVKGVPPGTTVAHKFAEKKIGNIVQFHDCGIVFYPENPHLVCVMTEGSDLDTLKGIVKDISGLISAQMKKSEDSVVKIL